MSKQCSVDGCINELIGRGLCHKHYKKWQRYGDPCGGIEHRLPGSGTVNHNGYLAVSVNYKKKLQHVLVAEEMLGHELPPGSVVHHIDGDRLNNDPKNLVICPSQAHHKLLHVQADALRLSGNSSFRKCAICKSYDDPSNLSVYSHKRSGTRYWHKKCHSLEMAKRAIKLKENV